MYRGGLAPGGKGILKRARKTADVFEQCRRRRLSHQRSESVTRYPPLSPLGAETGDRPSADRDHELLTVLGTTQHLRDTVAKFALRDGHHGHIAAKLLRIGGQMPIMRPWSLPASGW